MTGEQEKDNETGRIFKQFPKGFNAGDLYTTPSELRRSNLTRYGEQQIRHFFREGLLPGVVQIGRQIVLGEEDVKFILDRDQQKASGELITPGAPPGIRNPERGRRRLNKKPRG